MHVLKKEQIFEDNIGDKLHIKGKIITIASTQKGQKGKEISNFVGK